MGTGHRLEQYGQLCLTFEIGKHKHPKNNQSEQNGSKYDYWLRHITSIHLHTRLFCLSFTPDDQGQHVSFWVGTEEHITQGFTERECGSLHGWRERNDRTRTG